MAKLSKTDWLNEGLKILSEFAQDKIKMLYLCQRLKVTRGSFYHHFPSINHFIQDLLEFWKVNNTQNFILKAEQGNSPQEKIELLNQLVMETDLAIESAIRSWSHYNPLVKEQLSEVDDLRLKYLNLIFQEIGMDPYSAEQFSILEYATLIGVQSLYPRLEKQKLKELFEFRQNMLQTPDQPGK